MRITTFNVHFGKNTQGLAELFLQNKNLVQTEVLLLQEVESYPHETLGRAEKIAQTLGFNCVYSPARDAKKKWHPRPGYFKPPANGKRRNNKPAFF